MPDPLPYQPPRPIDIHRLEHEPQYRVAPPPPPTPADGSQSTESDRRLDAFNNVWDEPSLRPELRESRPPGELTWGERFAIDSAAVSATRSWTLVLLMALAAGPWAVVAVLLGGQTSVVGILTLVVLAPAAEEIMKMALPLLVVETRPHLFRSRIQILLLGVLGGLAFAVIENLIYLNIYIPDPSRQIVLWRWTVCVALHVVCSLVVAGGVARVWSHTARTRTPPRLSAALPFVIAATVFHGGYNALALLLEKVGWIG